MKILGIKPCRIDRLILPGDFAERLKRPHVVELSTSVKRYGVLASPMVRAEDRRVLYGRDRIASAVLAGLTHVDCKLVECTDEEAAEIELVENVHRRHDPSTARDQLSRLIQMYARQAVDTLPEPEPGAPLENLARKTPIGVARERVAREIGVKPESLRRRLNRTKAAQRKEVLSGERPAEPPCIELVGMEVTDEFLQSVSKAQMMLKAAESHANLVTAALQALDDAGVDFPKGRLERLLEEAKSLRYTLTNARPAALCPYCKGLPSVQPHCAACLQGGWISAEQARHVPRELWTTGKAAVVAMRGRYELVSAVIGDDSVPAESALEVLEEAEG